MRQKEALFDQFNEWGFDNRGWGVATRKRYVQRVRQAEAWLISNRNVSILFASTKDLKAFLFNTEPTARNRNNIRQALVAFGDFLVEEGIAKVNQAKELPRLREPEYLPKALSPKEAHRIEVAARHQGPLIESLVLMMLYGGLRREEVQQLQWANINDGWVRFIGKRQKPRAVPIAKPLQKALDRWKTKTYEVAWLFPSPKYEGRPMSVSMMRRIVRTVGGLAGLPDLHPHQLRHTAATRLLETGADVRTCQEFLGHTSATTTSIYLKVRPARLKEAMERLNYQEEEGGAT